jgi:hypothetical protein
MPYLLKEDRAAATRRWRERKRAAMQTKDAQHASFSAPRQQQSNVFRPQPSTVPSSRTSAFDVIKKAMNISANISTSPAVPHFKVRRVSEIPEGALRQAGITRQGNILSAGPGVDIQKFLRTWLDQP